MQQVKRSTNPEMPNPIAQWFEYAWPMGSGTIRRCGLIGGGVAFPKEVCHCGGGF